MLQNLSGDDSVSYVVVHKIDRLARNLEDHVTVRAQLRKLKIALVSATEGVEDSPQGMLVEGILASIAEFYSANLGQEVRKGMLQKVRNGGWPTQAPVGYQNVRADGGRKAESKLTLDPVMAPLVREAFEKYADGRVSLTALHAEMRRRGLKTARGTPIARSILADMLANPVYMGVVRWGGIEQAGIHPLIVTPELYERVQRVLRLRDTAGTRTRKHPHYLTGAVYCATCGSRLCLTVSKGRSAYFAYFFCVGRSQKRTKCAEAYVPLTDLEGQVRELYGQLHFSDVTQAEIQAAMDREIAAQTVTSVRVVKRQKSQLDQLTAQREKLLRAYYAEAIPVELLKREQNRIDSEVGAIHSRANVDVAKLEEGRDLVGKAMGLVEDCRKSYDAARGEAQVEPGDL